MATITPLEMPIDQLEPGQTAEIIGVLGHVEQVRRVEEMGLRRGRQIEMVQRGSPCIVRVGGTKLCFRSADACRVLVRWG